MESYTEQLIAQVGGFGDQARVLDGFALASAQAEANIAALAETLKTAGYSAAEADQMIAAGQAQADAHFKGKFRRSLEDMLDPEGARVRGVDSWRDDMIWQAQQRGWDDDATLKMIDNAHAKSWPR